MLNWNLIVRGMVMINKKRQSLNCVYIDILRILLGVITGIFAIILTKLNVSDDLMVWIAIILYGALYIFYIIYKTYWGIRNIKTGIKFAKSGDSDNLMSFMKITKFGSIPLYVIVFIIYFFMTLVMLLAPMGFLMIPFTLGPVVLFTYLNVIFTSAFTIGFLVDKKIKGEVSMAFVIINGILQFCFVLDVIDTIYLCVKFRKKKIEV